MTKIITSQSYLDAETVAAKVAAQDFDVTLSPAFLIDGAEYQVILDGHHSLAAARVAGVKPSYTIATATEDDRVALLEVGDVETFLEAAWADSDYRDAFDGSDPF